MARRDGRVVAEREGPGRSRHSDRLLRLRLLRRLLLGLRIRLCRFLLRSRLRFLLRSRHRKTRNVGSSLSRLSPALSASRRDEGGLSAPVIVPLPPRVPFPPGLRSLVGTPGSAVRSPSRLRGTVLAILLAPLAATADRHRPATDTTREAASFDRRRSRRRISLDRSARSEDNQAESSPLPEGRPSKPRGSRLNGYPWALSLCRHVQRTSTCGVRQFHAIACGPPAIDAGRAAHDRSSRRLPRRQGRPGRIPGGTLGPGVGRPERRSCAWPARPTSK